MNLSVSLCQSCSVFKVYLLVCKHTLSPGHILTENGIAAACVSTRLILVAGSAQVSSTEN